MEIFPKYIAVKKKKNKGRVKWAAFVQKREIAGSYIKNIRKYIQ